LIWDNMSLLPHNLLIRALAFVGLMAAIVALILLVFGFLDQ